MTGGAMAQARRDPAVAAAAAARRPALLAAVLAAALIAGPAAAQTDVPTPELGETPELGAPEPPGADAPQRAPDTRPDDGGSSSCFAFAQRLNDRLPVQFARYATGLAEEEVAITYVGHATFAIETADGVTVATDYAGFAGALNPPTVVTMNGAHSSHFTTRPDARIQHILRGWRDDGAPAGHDLRLGDLRIRSVSTDLRSSYGARRVNGNSVFIFEIADLCIGHLGHLHHVPTPTQFGDIGFLDVVFAAVDGGYTMSHAEMVQVLENLRARVVIPMHYFSQSNLERFLSGVGGSYDIKAHDALTYVVSADTLPAKPTMLLLPPGTGLLFDD